MAIEDGVDINETLMSVERCLYDHFVPLHTVGSEMAAVQFFNHAKISGGPSWTQTGAIEEGGGVFQTRMLNETPAVGGQTLDNHRFALLTRWASTSGVTVINRTEIH